MPEGALDQAEDRSRIPAIGIVYCCQDQTVDAYYRGRGLRHREEIAMKLFVGGLVGGLSNQVTNDDLKGLFAPYGQVDSATVVTDRFSGSPREFGFVEMPVRREAIAAIAALNGTELMGRTLEVNEARQPAERHRGPQGRGRDQHRGKRPGGGRRF